MSQGVEKKERDALKILKHDLVKELSYGRLVNWMNLHCSNALFLRIELLILVGFFYFRKSIALIENFLHIILSLPLFFFLKYIKKISTSYKSLECPPENFSFEQPDIREKEWVKLIICRRRCIFNYWLQVGKKEGKNR